MSKYVSIIGYSGHAFVACEILHAIGRDIKGYYERSGKEYNPYQLAYLGFEGDVEQLPASEEQAYFVALGDNSIRQKVSTQLEKYWGNAFTLIHPMSFISATAILGPGSMVSSQVSITAQARIGKGCICNTGSIIEHECILEDFVHIAPGATLCGGVRIGEGSLIGANAVVKPGISIGKNVTIGAGSVIVKPVPDHSIIIGNPQHKL